MKWIKQHIQTTLLIVVFGLILATNYREGTYLAGWDNLQSELAPTLAIKRAFWSGWQEYQSMGLAAGMGHAADLVRAVGLWILSPIIPQNMMRFLFHMSMILVGSLGVLKLLTYFQFGKKNQWLPFNGALFYLLNFYIIQMLYLPFEPFSVFVAALPWQVWIFFKTIEHSTKKNWFLFFLIFILSTPLGVAQQLFVVQNVILGLMALGLFITKPSKALVKNSLLAFFAILVINLFWLLPQAYFLYSNGSVVATSKINQIATSDVLFRNKDKGNITDFLSNTGFFYESIGPNQEYLFAPWKAHRDQLPTQIVIFSVAAISIVGLFRKGKYQLSFVFVYILASLALLSNTPPFEWINSLLRSNSFVNQIFRSPFTKFSIPSALILSYFFVSGLATILEFLKKLPAQTARMITWIVLLIATLFVLYQALPAFTGNYIANSMKTQIPQPYFKAMEYFKTQDKNSRIALLPDYTFWGWFYHNWFTDSNGKSSGYNGSGFLWYGIEQPMISRTFDVWSLESESYFWELKQAVESQDQSLLQNVLDKYDIRFLLLDSSLTPIVGNTKSLQYDELRRMLSQNQNITKTAQWDNLTLYKVENKKTVQDFVSIEQDIPNIGPDISLTNQDTAFSQRGLYMTNSQKPYDFYYPFLDITTQTEILNPEWIIDESDSSWIIARKIPTELKSNSISSESGNMTFNVYIDNETVEFSMPYTIKNVDGHIFVEFPKVEVASFLPKDAEVKDCIKPVGRITSSIRGDSLRVKSTGGANACFHYTAPMLDQRYGYIAKIQSQNIAGQNLFFFVQDQTKDQAYTENRLTKGTEYFLIGSRYPEGLGYAFSFQNDSLNSIPTENQLDTLKIYLSPYDVIKQLYYENPTYGVRESKSTQFEAKKISYYQYSVQATSPSTKDTLILSQSYNLGWKAYAVSSDKPKWLVEAFPFFFGNEFKSHFKVNNWANGWEIPSSLHSTQIIILYLPQYLQYSGFALLGATLTILGIAACISFFKRHSS